MGCDFDSRFGYSCVACSIGYSLCEDEKSRLGKLPDSRYAALDAQYAKEQGGLADEITELEKVIGGFEQSQKFASKFIALTMNINSNASFPKWLKKQHLLNLEMHVLVMFGENEFAFSIQKAIKCAKCVISSLELRTVKGASHLPPVSRPDYINDEVLAFINK